MLIVKVDFKIAIIFNFQIILIIREYGDKWCRGGNSLTKQTTYDDFISASEYLIKKKYTCPAKLIIEGQLFGGNLAGACLTQRPDLYAAVIIHEGYANRLKAI